MVDLKPIGTVNPPPSILHPALEVPPPAEDSHCDIGRNAVGKEYLKLLHIAQIGLASAERPVNSVSKKILPK